MTRSEIDEFVENWWYVSSRIFRYRREFFHDDYVVYDKKDKDTFVFDKKASTYKLLTDLNKDQLVKMMMNQELVYHSDKSGSTDCNYLKTGGCDCGAYLKKEWGHSHWCKLRFKNGY